MESLASKYNPDSNSPAEVNLYCDELRLLTDIDKKGHNGYNGLSLLSKREARRVLHIGNQNLNKLIDEGKIKVVFINGKMKIPYRNLEEFVYEASQISKKEDFTDSFEYLSEDAANEIIKEIIKEYK